jgi:uncharacterized glyoxalase superfamily protein PhnB
MSRYGAIPTLVYKDPNTAFEFLKNALGFQEHSVYRDDQNIIQHSELKLGEAMIMIGLFRPESEFGKMIGTPREANGLNTQTAYFIIDDVDSHYQIAKDAGAQMVMELKDEDYGGRGYSCKDPEGYIWNFGSYNPYSQK